MAEFVDAASNPALFYETRDLYEAAVIHSFHNPVLSVTRDRDGVCYFMFDKREKCEELVTEYRNRVLMVNAKQFIESIKTMKDFIYNGERGR